MSTTFDDSQSTFSAVTESTTPLQLLCRQLAEEQRRHHSVNFRRGCSLKQATRRQRGEYRSSMRRLKHRQAVLCEEIQRLQVARFWEWAAERERQIEAAREHGEPRVWVAHAMDLRDEPFASLSAELSGIPTVFCVFYIAGSAEHARQLHRRWCESGAQEGAAASPPANVSRTADVLATIERLRVR